MDQDQARLVLSRLAKKKAEQAERMREISDPKFPEQNAFVQDDAQFISGVCTRRAGKSSGLGMKFFNVAKRYPGLVLPYIALTRDSAKNIMWPVLQEVDQKYGLGAEFLDASLSVKVPGGATIKLFGADMKNFIRRLRGMKYPFGAVDEAQEFGSHIESLVDDVMTPSISDFGKSGQIAITGTPGAIPKGYFYDVTEKGKYGYSVHKWSLYQNPYMPDPKGFVARLKKKKGWTDQNPTYLREWCGQWVEDLEKLVYKFKKAKNCYATLPDDHKFLRILSIDYGWNDQTAFAVVCYSQSLREVFVEHVEGHSEFTPSEIAGRIGQLRETYSPIRIVADTGGLGKSITEEMIRRYHIPIKPAEKKEKLTNISLLNGDFTDQRLWVHESLTKLHDQYLELMKGDDHQEDPKLPNDLCDAVLYGYREAKHYLGELPEDTPEEGTPEHGEKVAQKMLKEDLEAFEDAQLKAWWEN